MLGAHPLLITLAASFMILVGVLVYTEGRTTGTVPDYLLQAVSPAGRTGPIPLPPIVLVWFLLSVLVVAVEQLSVPGRLLFATGASERAASLTRPVIVIWAAAFAASSACAAIAGILLAGFSGGADASVGQPYLFQTVAAVVVGGTALLGGSGSYARTFAGVLLITELTTFLIGLGFSDRIQQVMLGLLITCSSPSTAANRMSELRSDRRAGLAMADASAWAPGNEELARSAAPSLLRVTDLRKSYGATQALRSCNIDVAPGEIRALLGENGSGKSTLVKILSGVVRADAGSVELSGALLSVHSPREAQARGIVTVFQETLVAPELPVLDNIFLGSDRTFRWGRPHAEQRRIAPKRSMRLARTRSNSTRL